MGGVLGRLTRSHGPTLTDGGRVVAYSTAVFFAGAGILHVSAAADHTNLPVMMVGFLFVATCQAAFAGLLLWRRPGGLLLVVGLALTAGAIGTWLISRTLGLPFLPGGHMEPIGFKDGVTVLFELASIPGLLLLASPDLPWVRLPSQRLGTQTVAGLAAAAFLLFVPALVLGGGEHHSAAQLEAMGDHSHGEEKASNSHDDGGSHGVNGKELASADAGDHAHSAAQSEKDGHSHGEGGSAGPADLSGGSSLGVGGGSLASGGGHDHGGGDNRGGGHEGGGRQGAGHEEGAQRGDGHQGGDHGGRGENGDGHEERRGQQEGGQQEGGHQEGHHGGGGAEEPGGGQGGDMPGGDDPGGLRWGEHSFDYEPAKEGKDGAPGSGYAFVYRGPANSSHGTVGHHSDEPCNPTPEQREAADRLYRATWPAVRKYDNNFAKAIADGFIYMFPLTDRIIHMVHPGRVWNPTILDPAQIESFLYVMTDEGLTAVGGMYVMPKYGMPGPQIGGCLTRWHEHAGLAGRLTTAGTQDRTPEMLHVWTYRGLDPWAHYDGRSLSQLWTLGSPIPSVCRETGDASDACLP